MAGLSYLYTSLANSSSSFDMSTLNVPRGGIVKITTANDIATPSIAVIGIDYYLNLASTTGLRVAESEEGAVTINLPGSGTSFAIQDGDLLVGNGSRYLALAKNDSGDVLTVTGVAPLSIDWIPDSGGGHPSTWAQYAANHDVNLYDGTTYHRFTNTGTISFKSQTISFVSPDSSPTLWASNSGTPDFNEYLLFGSTTLSATNIAQGLLSDIGGSYAQEGSFLAGTGLYYTATSISTGTNGQALTSNGSFPGWTTLPISDPAAWSQYPATQDVNMNGWDLYNIQFLKVIPRASPPNPEKTQGDFYVDSVTLAPKYFQDSGGSGLDNFQVTASATGYGAAGSLLIGNGIDFNPLPIAAQGDVLILTNPGGAGLEPTWVAQAAEVPNFTTVNCVMWISSGYTGLAAYTYNNGTAGVGATLTYNSNFALTPSYIDNYNGANGTAGVLAGIRILVVDNNNPTYSGIYTLTQVGSGGTPPILTRAADFNTPTEMSFGKRIYVTPYIPYIFGGDSLLFGISSFSGQFVDFMTAPTIVIGITALTFVSTVFTETQSINVNWMDIAQVGFFPAFPRGKIPDGGRKFYASSFATSAVLDPPDTSGFVTYNVTFGRFDSEVVTYTAYTNPFAFNAQTLVDRTNCIIPIPNGTASTLYPNDFLSYGISDAPELNVGSYLWYVTFIGQWVQ